jgi:hypothetical protein
MSKKNKNSEVIRSSATDQPETPVKETETSELSGDQMETLEEVKDTPKDQKPAEEKAESKPGVMSVTTAVTSEVIRSSATDPGKDKRLVDIKISYPEGYKGTRHMKEGVVYEVSPETAEVLIKKGIAKKCSE